MADLSIGWNRARGYRHGCDKPGHHGLRRARAGQLRGKEPGVFLDLLAAAMPDGCSALYRAMDRPTSAISGGEVALRISAQPREDLIAAQLPASARWYCLRMIFSENRCTPRIMCGEGFFRIMRYLLQSFKSLSAMEN